MNPITRRLAVLLAALGTAGGLAQAQTDRTTGAEPAPRQDAEGGRQQRQEEPPTGVLLFVPLQFAEDERWKGCWVRLYDGTNFQGQQLTIIGPASIPDLDRVTGWGDPDSAVVGPNARVTAYDNDDYTDHAANLLPGQRLADLQNGTFGLFQDLESLRVACRSS